MRVQEFNFTWNRSSWRSMVHLITGLVTCFKRHAPASAKVLQTNDPLPEYDTMGFMYHCVRVLCVYVTYVPFDARCYLCSYVVSGFVSCALVYHLQHIGVCFSHNRT